MKRQKLMTAGTILLALIFAAVLAVPIIISRAQSGGGILDVLEQARQAQAQQIEGSWTLAATTVVPPGTPAPAPVFVYASFARGGVYIGADRRFPTTKQLGSWVHLDGNEFASTFISDQYDTSGVFTGTLKIRVRYNVINKDEFVGVANVEVRDANDTVTAIRCATIKAQRTKVEPLAALCQGITPPQ